MFSLIYNFYTVVIIDQSNYTSTQLCCSDCSKQIFSTFLHTEYGGPGTLLVIPFIDMADTLDERGLPGGPQAARAAVKWAQDYVDKDWKEWTGSNWYKSEGLPLYFECNLTFFFFMYVVKASSGIHTLPPFETEKSFSFLNMVSWKPTSETILLW